MARSAKIIIAVVLTILSIISLVFIGNKLINKSSQTNDNTGTTITESEIENQVDDFKSKLTIDNIASTLKSINSISSKYSLSENSFYSGQNFNQGWRIINGVTIDGSSINNIESENDSFSCIYSSGIGGEAPDIAITFTTTEYTQDEIEKTAYEILDTLSTSEVVEILKSIDYNNMDMAEITDNLKQTLTLTKNKSVYTVNEEGQDTDNNKTVSTYTYGIKYIPLTDKLYNKFEQKEFDNKIYTAIPIFSKLGIEDINDNSILMPWITAQNVTDIRLTDYSYTSGTEADTCTFGLDAKSVSGETLRSSFTIKYSEGSGLVEYSFNTMTGYNETVDTALLSGINLINEITGIETAVENYIPISETTANGEQTFIYMETLPSTEDDIQANLSELTSSLFTVDIKYEPELGYYAYIVAE